MHSAASSSNVHCPRCGYDQRGAMATWDEKGSCPLEVTCAECGLTFLWRDLLRPTFSEPRWCVEHAPRRVRTLARSIIGTFARQWLPWKFWRRVQLQHRIRLRRIAIYLLVLSTISLFGIYLATQIAAASVVRYNISPLMGMDRQGLREALDLVAEQLAAWDAIEKLSSAAPEQRLQAVVWSSYRAKGTWNFDFDAHEGVANSLTTDEWAALWLEHRDALEDEQVWLEAATENIGFGYVAAIAEAVLTPWKSQSTGRLYRPSTGDTTGMESVAYPPPRSIHTEAVLFRGGGYGQLPWEYLVEPIFGPAFMWCVLALTYPFTFLLLPITRRRAKVRWIHFARITAYSLTFPLLALCAACATIAAAVFWPNAMDSIAVWGAILIGVTPMLLLLAWWYCAIRFHLRLPNALAVTVIMALLNGLIVVSAMAFIGVTMQYLFYGQ